MTETQHLTAEEVWAERVGSTVDAYVDQMADKFIPVAIEQQMTVLDDANGLALTGCADLIAYTAGDAWAKQVKLINGVPSLDPFGRPAVDRVPWPRDKMVVVDWKTSKKKDGMFSHTLETMPQLALYSFLTRQHFELDYWPGVMVVRFVYTCNKGPSTCTVQTGDILSVSDLEIGRALEIMYQDLEIQRAVKALGSHAPRPDAGNWKCTNCQYRDTACRVYDKEQFQRTLEQWRSNENGNS